MTKYILALVIFLSACAGDIALITVEKNQDTAETIIDGTEATEPSAEPGTEAEPSSEPSNEMSDLTIGFAEMHFYQYACPACMGITNEFDISANLKLHQPTSGNYNELLTPVGQCQTSMFESHVSSSPLQASQPVYFNQIQLNPIGQGEWSIPFFYEHQYERNTSYTISTEHGIINNAFTSIEGFDSIEPYTLLWVDPSYAFDTAISRSSGANFSWYPIIPNSQFEIMIAVYSPDGAQLLGTISCMENDNGYMNVPGVYFQNYPTWSLAAVYLTRHRTERQPAPDLNGWIESHITWSAVGTGHIE
jgi:hypothetical protein